jgi:biofilm PGA synthesis N-glycosyltransferase PgaC
LVEDLADPRVGAVGGELVLDGVAPASAYWRYEAWIRRNEGRAGSTVGVSGALWATRRALWRPLPPGAILDDVLAPERLRAAGLRVTFQPAARAFDRAVSSGRELARKVRTLSGNLQLVALVPSLLVPWRPGWFEFASHKLLRLVAPWALLAALFATAALGPPWRAPLLALQLAGYGLGVASLLGARALPLARFAETFVVLHVAALAAWFRFLRRGRALPW